VQNRLHDQAFKIIPLNMTILAEILYKNPSGTAKERKVKKLRFEKI